MQKLLNKFSLLFLIVFLCGCQKQQTVITGLDEREANMIVVFLYSKGISAVKTAMPSSGVGGGESTGPKFNIDVNSADSVKAMAFLNQNGLPRKQGTTLLDLFSNTGLMSSDKQETIRYQAGLEQQITNTIMMIDGVIDATVQISFPPQDLGGATPPPITASIYVKHQGVIDDPNSHLETKIKRLISGAVTGLDVNNVTVVSDRSRYTDISPKTIEEESPESKEYINIWSIALAKDSITKFRTLFFTLMIFVLLLATATAWLLWKMYPMIRKTGFGEFFKVQPFQVEKKVEETPSNEETP